MKTCSLPIAKAVVSFRTRGPIQIEPAPKMLSGPGFVSMSPYSSYEVAVDGYPIIIAGMERDIILTHSKNANVISNIVSKFKIKLGKISMSIQFADEENETKFFDYACNIGLRNVWTANPINEHLSLYRYHTKPQNHLIIERRV